MKESEISWLQFDKRLLFVLLTAIFILLIFLRTTLIESETALVQVWEEDGKAGVLHLFNGLSYLGVPLFLLAKVTLVACGLWIASFGIGYRLTFDSLWRIILLGQTVFVLPEVLRILYFLVTPGDPSYYEVRDFFPLSLGQVTQGYPEYYAYALKRLNLFELFYWVYLTLMVHRLARKKWAFALLIVILGYLLPFLLWVGYSVLPPSAAS